MHLIATARANNVVLQIGHLERFNSAVVALDNVLDNPRFIECLRLAPFKPRVTDINVVLDLMIHDIDIIQSMVKSPIKDIRANGAHVLSERIDIANARIELKMDALQMSAQVASVLIPELKILFFSTMRILHSIYITKHSVFIAKVRVKCFPGIPDIICDQQVFDQGDALNSECKAFLSSILDGAPVLVTGDAGRAALATATSISLVLLQRNLRSRKLHRLDL